MRPHEEISEQLVSVVSCRGVEPLLGATGPRDQLVAILQIAVLDHFFLSGLRGGSARGVRRSRLAEWTTERVTPSGATRLRWMRLLSCARGGAARRRRRRAVRASGRPA